MGVNDINKPPPASGRGANSNCICWVVGVQGPIGETVGLPTYVPIKADTSRAVPAGAKDIATDKFISANR